MILRLGRNTSENVNRPFISSCTESSSYLGPRKSCSIMKLDDIACEQQFLLGHKNVSAGGWFHMVKQQTLFECLNGVVCTLDIGDQSLIFNWLSRKLAVLLAWGDKTPIKQTQKFGTLGGSSVVENQGCLCQNKSWIQRQTWRTARACVQETSMPNSTSVSK